MSYTYRFPRPALTADIALLGLEGNRLVVLLIQRKNAPFAGQWALPGGFVDQDEDLLAAARRELQEETGLSQAKLRQIYTFGTPGRDPRGHTVTVLYSALVPKEQMPAHAADDAAQARWFPVDQLPPLAFDHHDLLQCTFRYWGQEAQHRPIGQELLPELFTLDQLRHLYEALFRKNLDPERFAERITDMDLVLERPDCSNGSRLFQFDKEEYGYLRREGFFFRP